MKTGKKNFFKSFLTKKKQTKMMSVMKSSAASGNFRVVPSPFVSFAFVFCFCCVCLLVGSFFFCFSFVLFFCLFFFRRNCSVSGYWFVCFVVCFFNLFLFLFFCGAFYVVHRHF